jgi:hypothetical protein
VDVIVDDEIRVGKCLQYKPQGPKRLTICCIAWTICTSASETLFEKFMQGPTPRALRFIDEQIQDNGNLGSESLFAAPLKTGQFFPDGEIRFAEVGARFAHEGPQSYNVATYVARDPFSRTTASKYVCRVIPRMHKASLM